MDSVRVDTRRPPPPTSRELIPLKVLVAESDIDVARDAIESFAETEEDDDIT